MARTVRDGDCLLWQGASTRQGYGTARFNGKVRKVHRMVLIHASGKDEPSMEAAHKCDTPACINPEHLEWQTRSQNMLQKVMGGRHPRQVLTPEQVQELRHELEKGTRQAAIAPCLLYTSPSPRD